MSFNVLGLSQCLLLRCVVYVADKAFDILKDYITTIADELKGLLSSSAHEL